MYLIVNQKNQAFSKLTASDAFVYVEHWVENEFSFNLPINVTIYPSQGMAMSTITNILACRSVKDETNKNEILNIVPFNKYFKVG